MKKNLTELVFILDKSGSMQGKQEDVIGGFNSIINEQESDNAYVTTVLFSDNEETLYDRLKLKDVKPIGAREYHVGGCTALIDAIGNTIKHISTIQKYADKKPDKTIFMIMTDGLENASTKYSSDEVKKTIEKKKEEGWEFVFLGANIDAVETARAYGIEESRAVNFHNDKKGIRSSFKAVSNFMNLVAEDSLERVDEGEWRKDADEDYKSRNNRS